MILENAAEASVIRCEPFSNWYRIVQAFLAGEVYGNEIGMIIDKDCEHEHIDLLSIRPKGFGGDQFLTLPC